MRRRRFTAVKVGSLGDRSHGVCDRGRRIGLGLERKVGQVENRRIVKNTGASCPSKS